MMVCNKIQSVSIALSSLFVTINVSMKISVCPNENDSAEQILNHIRDSILCDQKPSVNCSELQNIFDLVYESNFVIIHRGEWRKLSALSQFLTSCGYGTVFYDAQETASNLTTINLSTFCTTRKSSVIISVTELQFAIQRKSETDCVIQDVKTERILNSVVKCPRTVWSLGTGSCNTNGSEILNLRRYETVDTKLDSLSTSLNNKSIIVATVEVKSTPWVIKEIDSEGVVTYTGLVFEILNKLSIAFNFRYTVVEPDDQKAGTNTTNGSWNGLIGMLQRQEVDVAATSLTVTWDRSTVVRFSSTFYLESLGILMQMPNQKGRVWRFDFLFSTSVWLTIIIGLLIAVVFIFILHKYNTTDEAKGFELLLHCFWYCFNSVVNQAAHVLLNDWSSQAFLACWQLFVVSIVATYSGSLVSVLTSSRFSLPFKDYDGMMLSIHKGETKVCIEEGTAFQMAVWGSDSSSNYYQLKVFLQSHPNYVTTRTACVDYILKDSTVVYIDEITTLKNAQYNYCSRFQLIILADRFFPGYFALAFQKDSDISEIFSTGVATIAESGLIDTWKAKYSIKPSFCEIMEPDTKPMATMLALNVTEVIGAFLVLAVGLAFAMVVIVIEFKKQQEIKRPTRIMNLKNGIDARDRTETMNTVNSTSTVNSFVS